MLEGQRRHSLLRQGGYVYFIRGADKVKIGIAVDPAKRLADLQCGSPVPLQIVGLIETNTPTKLESDLHKRFAKYRKHLEWFEYSHEIRLYIERKAAPPGTERPFTTNNPYENELLKVLAHGEWMGRGALFMATGRTSWPKNLEKAMNALIDAEVVETQIVKLPQNGNRVTHYRLTPKGQKARVK